MENKNRTAVLMVTPFIKQQRGNSITAGRIRSGMEENGWQIDLYSLETKQSIKRLKKEAEQKQYSMIHGFHAGYIGTMLAEMPQLKVIPLLLTMTGTDLQKLSTGIAIDHLTRVLHQASFITVFHTDYMSLLQELCPAWGEKAVLVPQGVDLQDGPPFTRKELGLESQDFVFILPSGLRAIKDIDLAIDAALIVIQKGYRAKLLIAGPAMEINYADRLNSRFIASAEIKYLGAVEHADMKQLLLLADAVINCSQAEGQPQAVLEAMSLGKPCIMTAVPGNFNIIENYREGIYVKDAEEMAAAMEFFLKEPEQLQAMGKAAAQLVAEKFSVKAEIETYDALYRQIVGR